MQPRLHQFWNRGYKLAVSGRDQPPHLLAWLHIRVGDLGDPGRPLRVVLADDNVLLREGIAGLLERAGFEIAGQAGDADALIALVRAQRPDLVVVDIRMPPSQTTEGLKGAATIREKLPDSCIMV